MGSTNRILDGHIRLYGRVSPRLYCADFVKEQPCKFKIIQETLDSDSKTISLSRSRLENEKNILLKLQSTHAEGAKFHVACLVPRLNWNDSDQEDFQD
jgi:hypothetical protein